MDGHLYLGLELSTQQVRCIVLDSDLRLVYTDQVGFDSDLPQFGTYGGVHRRAHDEVTAPVGMWLAAIDRLFDAAAALKGSGRSFDLSRVTAISGAAQQHGSVFWSRDAESRLKGLCPAMPLHSQMEGCFSLLDCPVWMDSSTHVYCKQLEASAGGPQTLADITGSRAYERFTGNQIAKIAHLKPDVYEKTWRISLISSFLASLFLGEVAPIDYSDGSGMNLLDITAKKWDLNLVEACGSDLEKRLGQPTSTRSILGLVSSYWQQRFGFLPSCKVVAFTGDNPASLAGLNLQRGDLLMSLGTSDTLMLWLDTPKPALIGHVFVNPLDDLAYMGMLCFKNGSFTREEVRKSCGLPTWGDLNHVLELSPPGNEGNVGVYFLDTEIIPRCHGVLRWNRQGKEMAEFPPHVEVRALLEGQIMAKRLHAESLGFVCCQGGSGRILVTGGASRNQKILQIISDVFNSSVYVLPGTENSACYGSTLRACYFSLPDHRLNYAGFCSNAVGVQLAAIPDHPSSQTYNGLIEHYKSCETALLRKSQPDLSGSGGAEGM